MASANSSVSLRLGARGSLLSRLQSQSIARALEAAHPGLTVETVIISTSGDRIQNQPLHAFGGKGLFTKELEQALLNNEVDFAVHSFKDVPVTMPLVDVSTLTIVAVPVREDPREVLISPHAKTLRELPPNAKVGTGSLRRQAQILALRPDLKMVPIRGNIDTRIRKLREGSVGGMGRGEGAAGGYDAVILALAGLKRADLFDPLLMTPIPLEEILPSAGQAALALQCRSGDTKTLDLLRVLDHSDTHLAVGLERQMVQALNGDCHSPIGALAQVEPDQIYLRANLAAREGQPPVYRAETRLPKADSKTAVAEIMRQFHAQGVDALFKNNPVD